MINFCLRYVGLLQAQLVEIFSSTFIILIKDSCSSNLLSSAQAQSLLAFTLEDTPAVETYQSQDVPIMDLDINITSLCYTAANCGNRNISRNGCRTLQDLLDILHDTDPDGQNMTLLQLARFSLSGERVPLTSSSLSEPAVKDMLLPSSSRDCLAISPTFSVFRVLHMSAWASSTLFNNVNEYPYFFRGVPSDDHQAVALADLIEEFGFQYIVLLGGADEVYSGPGFKLLREEAFRRGTFCLAVQARFSADDPISIRSAIAQIRDNPEARAMVVFATMADGAALLHALGRQNVTGRILLGSEDWLNRVDFSAFSNTVLSMPIFGYYPDPSAVFLHSGPSDVVVKATFGSTDFILGMAALELGRLYIEQEGDCTFPNPLRCENQSRADVKQCTRYTVARFPRRQPTMAMPMIRLLSLYTNISVVMDVERPFCEQGDCTVVLGRVPADGLRRAMREFTVPCRFHNGTRRAPCHTFTDTQAAYPAYSLRMLSVPTAGAVGTGTGLPSLQAIANWDGFAGPDRITRLTWLRSACIQFGVGECINMHDRRQSGEEKQTSKASGIPLSACSAPCNPGTFLIPSADPMRFCCWRCVECAPGQISSSVNAKKCSACATGLIANGARTECVMPRIECFPWSSHWTGFLIAWSVITCIFSVTSLVYFIRYHKTPAIRAANLPHMIIIMLTPILSSIVHWSFLHSSRSSDLVCTLERESAYSVPTLGFIALMMKTNRMRHLFNTLQLVTASRWRRWLVSASGQVLLVFILFLVANALSSVPSFLYPPTAKLVLVSADAATYVCEPNFTAEIFSLVPLSIFVIVTAVLVFQTRNLPDEYNDSKLILLVCAVDFGACLVFAVVYYNDEVFRPVVVLLLGLWMSTSFSVILCAPRIYWHRYGYAHPRERPGSRAYRASMDTSSYHRNSDLHMSTSRQQSARSSSQDARRSSQYITEPPSRLESLQGSFRENSPMENGHDHASSRHSSTVLPMVTRILAQADTSSKETIVESSHTSSSSSSRRNTRTSDNSSNSFSGNNGGCQPNSSADPEPEGGE